MATPAAVLNIMLTANTAQANAALAKTQAQLSGTAKTATATSATIKKAMLGIGAVAAGAGYALFKVGEEFDDAYDKISTRTGATGRELKRLKGDFRNIAGSVPADFDSVATALGNVNQRLDATGPRARKLSKQFLELSRITESDVEGNITAVSKAFLDWEVKTKNQSKTLDGFFKLEQQSGMAVADIAANVQKFGSPLRQLGFSLEESAAMFANFEQSGVNIQTMVPGLKLAISNLTRPTETLAESMKGLGIEAGDPEKALKKVFDLLSNDRISQIERTGLAMDVFGKRAGADMAEAIKQGRFQVDDLMKAFDNSEGSIRDQGRRTMDLAEHWQRFTNLLKLKVEPIATDVFQGLGDLMKEVSRAFKQDGFEGVLDLLFQKLDNAMPKITALGGKIAGKLLQGFAKFFWENPLLGTLFLGAGAIKLFGGNAVLMSGGKALGQKLGGGMKAGLLGMAAVAGIQLARELERSMEGHGSMSLAEGLVPQIDRINRAIRTAFKQSDLAGLNELYGLLNAMKQSAINSGERVPPAIEKSIDAVAKARRKMGADLSGIIGKFDDFVDGSGKMSDRFDKHVRDMRSSLDSAVDKFKSFTSSSGKSLDKAGDNTRNFGKRSGKNLDGLRKILDSLSGAWGKGLDVIGDNTNSLLKGLKVGKVAYSIKKGDSNPIDKGANFFQRGGPINLGAPSGDTVPAMLERGEYVLNRNAVAAIGTQNLDALNFRGAPRFQTGGMAGLQPGIARLAKYANERLGLQVSSGLRPGDSDSWHGKGMAVDLVPPGMSATRNLFSTFKNQLEELFYDPWGGYDSGQMIGPIGGHMDHIHAAIVGSGSPAQVGSSRVKRVLLKGPKGPLRDAGQAALDKARSAANAFIRKNSMHGNLGSGGGALSPGEFLALAKRALFITDKSSVWGGSDGFSASGLLALAKQESSLVPSSINNWDINAQQGNPSGGLMHLTQSNMKAYAEPSLSSNMFDPLSSIAASINYQIDRYGGQVTHSPYQVGGLVNYLRKGGKPKKGGPQLNIEGPAWFHPDPSKVRISEPFKTAKKVREQIGLIEHLDERIDLAGRLADLDGEFSEGERKQAIHLNTDLLRKLNKVRTGSEYVLDKTGRQLERKNVPGWQKKLLRPLLSEFGDTLRDVSGVTGKGGRIFDTMLTLAELGKRPETVDPEPTAPLRISELVRFAEAARLAGIGNFAGTFAKGGSIPRGQWGITGERGPEIVHGPATVAPLGGPIRMVADIPVEITLPDGSIIRKEVRAELRQRDRSALNEHRAGVTV